MLPATVLENLATLDDEQLKETIEDQQRMISKNPMMQCVLGPALEQCVAERKRRWEKSIRSVVPENGAYTSDDAAKLKAIKKEMKQAAIAPYRECGKRARTAPERFHQDPVPITTVPEYTEEEQHQANTNRLLQDQLAQNIKQLRERAMHLSCPLLVQDEGKKGDPGSGSALDYLLRTQMQQVAVATDGYQYDFERIKKYIRENWHRQLVSPVTGEPMNAEVYFTKRERTKQNKVIANSPLVTSVWPPTPPPYRYDRR